MNIIGGENVATGPMFVKRVKIEKDSTDVDIRVAIVIVKRDETQTTMELIKSTHEDYAYGLKGKGLIYKMSIKLVYALFMTNSLHTIGMVSTPSFGVIVV